MRAVPGEHCAHPRRAPETGPGLENGGYKVATPSCQLPSLLEMVLGVRKARVGIQSILLSSCVDQLLNPSEPKFARP